VRQALQRGYRWGTLKVCRRTGEGVVLGVGFVTGCYGASGWHPPNRPLRVVSSSAYDPQAVLESYSSRPRLSRV
jgi:hypothetical protein